MVDAKWRTTIHPAWRPDAGAELYLLLTATHGMPMIKVLTLGDFDDRMVIIENSSKTDGEKRKLKGQLATLCRLVVASESQKILIPRDIGEKAEIKPDSEVMLVGRELHYEIWNKSNFDKSLNLEMKRVVDTDDNDDLGIF